MSVNDKVIPLEELNQYLNRDVDKNIEFFNRELNADKCFDIIKRELEICGEKAILYTIDGFTNNESIQKITQHFLTLKQSDYTHDAQAFLKTLIPYGEANVEGDIKKLIIALLSGNTILLVNGIDKGFIMDCRTYPVRSVEEPEKDKVLKGSRDGFVEILTSNTALIRRRIRDPRLTLELLQIGERSYTDIAICYLSDKVNPDMLERLRKKLKSIKVESLTMNQQSLAECLFPYKWFNPFPKYRFTERPDTTSACILEGNIVLLVDNSPAAMILPSSFCDIYEEANDYYFPPLTGTYLRISRLLTVFLALFFTPTFLLLMDNPEWIPASLSFIVINEQPNIPFWFQFVMLEFAIDGLKLAAVNTPSMLNTPLSIIAGIVLGEYAVSSGWFSAEILLYMSFVAVANYSQSSFELGYAIKFLRMQLLLLTALLSIWGYIAGVIIIITSFVTNKTITGESYLYPIQPFSFKKLIKRIVRGRLKSETKESR